MKKFLLLLLAMLLVALPVALAEETTTYGFEDGNYDVFTQSGSCSVGVSTAMAHTGEKSLAITGRSGNNCDAADLNVAGAGIPQGAPVTISAWVYVDADGEDIFCIAKSAGDWGWLGNATIPGRVWTEVTASFTLNEDVNIRFQNNSGNWNTADIYLDDITVTVGEPAPEVVVAETVDTAFDFESGMPSQFGPSGSAQPAVSTAQAHGGTSSLFVTGRSGNNWDAADLNSEAMGIAPFAPVKITAWVYVDSDEEGTFRIAKSDAGWDTLGQATFPGRTWTEITAEFSLDQLVNIRFQNSSDNWNNANYYIDDVAVSVGVPVEQEEIVSDAPPIDYHSDFSEGLDGWYPRSGNEAAALTVTDEGGIEMTGRTGTWNSPGRDFELVPGKTYNLSVLVKQDVTDSTGFILSIAHTRDDTESYENLGTCTAKRGEWTLIQCTYVAGRYDKYVLYVEGGAEDTVFQIKDFTCVEPVSTFGSDDLASLKEVYADLFDVGTAVVGSEVLDEDRMEFYASQFSIFTYGNEMKPDSLLDLVETRKLMRANGNDQTTVALKFDSCIPLLDWAKENNVKVHGHVLVWHQQTTERFFHEDYATHKPLLDRETMLKRMENYISQVLTWTNENYPGVIVSWDVVNEAIADSAADAVEGNDWRLRNSLWAQVIGEDFVNRAFEYARKYAAPGTLLFYNDYNTDDSAKQRGILKLVDSLIADGTIDGYGFQSHYSVGWPQLNKVEVAWNNLCTRNLKDGSPLLLRVSELDVGIDDTSEENLQKQAKYYSDLFKIYQRHADRIIAVQVWGTVDDLSWRAANYPLLFDAKAQPKPAFQAVVDALVK